MDQERPSPADNDPGPQGSRGSLKHFWRNEDVNQNLEEYIQNLNRPIHETEDTLMHDIQFKSKSGKHLFNIRAKVYKEDSIKDNFYKNLTFDFHKAKSSRKPQL